MNGDPKVVAALAVAILALPPVVNAIMAKAAEQAETDWLRDQDWLDPEGPPPDDVPPIQHRPPGEPPEEPPPTPPPREEPPPACDPVARPGDPRNVGLLQRDSDTLEVTTQAGDTAVFLRIRGSQVSGSPVFELARDGAVQWREDRTRVGESFEEPAAGGSFFPDDGTRLEAGEVWEFRYDLNNAVFNQVEIMFVSATCEVPDER